jgi:hypothetical protein
VSSPFPSVNAKPSTINSQPSTVSHG